MALAPKTVRLCGWYATEMGRTGMSTTKMQSEALDGALKLAGIREEHLDGLIAVPSLAQPRFMEAHSIATHAGLLPRGGPSGEKFICRTIDTGGAGPVTALLTATRMVRDEWCEVVGIVAADAVMSLPTEEFLRRADAGCQSPVDPIDSPVIPNGYDRFAQWYMNSGMCSREQLAMCSVLMSHQAPKHPKALCRTPHTLQQVLDSPPVGKVTTRLECARRADGGGALIVASSRFLERHNIPHWRSAPVVMSGGEGSGPLYPPPLADITEDHFSCEEACGLAYSGSNLDPSDIDFFGLYDCFPICLLRALEAAGVCKKGEAGQWVSDRHSELVKGTAKAIPVNTHGGLLAYGAPWETPAIYNVIEACEQIIGKADGRQLESVRRALVYGNGGIFSASAVAIIGRAPALHA
eukprot:TRINITY_DN6926_c3_g1_i1.p1 TRINITY_DN6926_c3_g1~~TRINITY_DN6926_c3_g1_i1.p1  ORF type:complete len:427 (+),score=56.74 TRINITY_DN6926_c3_g1_i1:56-1282(+)